jgi:hypothetical protein
MAVGQDTVFGPTQAFGPATVLVGQSIGTPAFFSCSINGTAPGSCDASSTTTIQVIDVTTNTGDLVWLQVVGVDTSTVLSSVVGNPGSVSFTQVPTASPCVDTTEAGWIYYHVNTAALTSITVTFAASTVTKTALVAGHATAPSVTAVSGTPSKSTTTNGAANAMLSSGTTTPSVNGSLFVGNFVSLTGTPSVGTAVAWTQGYAQTFSSGTVFMTALMEWYIQPIASALDATASVNVMTNSGDVCAQVVAFAP